MPPNALKPAKAKERLLRETCASFLSMVGEAFAHVGDVELRAELRKKTYGSLRGK